MRVLSVVLIIVLATVSLFSGSTGKIAGLVKDKKTGEPLIGVNIRIEGQSMGAASDFDGQFSVINIPPGEYSIIASLVGYQQVRVTDVRVKIDLTTTVNIEMSDMVLDLGQEVIVIAERPMVQKDLTATTAVIGSKEIDALPVTEVSAVLSLQAGFVAGSLRGGRSGEVAYWIDGVPVTDAFNGSQVVEVNKNLVQEMQLVSGAFNAEYGQAMSGIVNIATREGGEKFKGSIGMYMGDYLSGDEDLFKGISDFDPLSIKNIEGSVSGPIFGNDLTFFANARYIRFGGYLNGYNRYRPENISYILGGDTVINRDAAGLGDNSLVSLNWSERKYGQGKLTWRISPMIKASVNSIYDYSVSKAYSRDYYLNPDGVGRNYSNSLTSILQVTHTLSNSTFYTIGASYFDKTYKYYVYEDPHDPRYTHPDLYRYRFDYSFLTGGTDMGRFERSTQTGLVKVDFSSQFDQSNMLKFGVEYRTHNIYYDQYSLRPVQTEMAFDPLTAISAFVNTEIPADTEVTHNTYRRKPDEFSFYVQDKMEFKDLIINIGVRFDYFRPDGYVLNDESDPDILNPLKPVNIAKTLAERRLSWYKRAADKYQLSPRFGASFPVTDRGVVHFSYGHFFQIPRFERLYENPNFKIGSSSGDHVAVIGNADLKPEQTISGELGVQQQVTEDVSMDVTMYFRDIRNLTGTRGAEISIFGAGTYDKYVNSDFGLIKGVVLSVTKSFIGGFGATMDYTYQVARGTASDPSSARNALAGGALPEVQQVPLSWDQRHTLNVTASYNADDWGVSFISQYGSGTPYTPKATQDVTALLTNSQLKPQYFNVDTRAYYNLQLGFMRAVWFFRVFNLFDIRNEVGVFDDTGRAGFTTYLSQARKTNPAEKVNSLEDMYTNPTFYSEPRRIEIGLNLEF